MTGFRDIKRMMRRDVQSNLCVPAFYLRTPTSEPVLVNVRVRLAFNKIGAIQGVRIHPAEMQNESDTIRFDLAEMPFSAMETPRVERGAVVSVAPGEAYRLDNILPRDDQFQSAEASRCPANEAVAYPVPESCS